MKFLLRIPTRLLWGLVIGSLALAAVLNLIVLIGGAL